MPKPVPFLQENKKPFHQRNGSGEIHVFESARYFDNSYGTTLSRKHDMREGGGRLSLDIPKTRRNSIPLQAMMMENRNSVPLQSMLIMDENPMMIKNDIKKHKQPSSPGGKLAHFLNSLFNQTSSKKSKSKSITSTYSLKDEDESPSGWRRRRRSSISLFRSGNSNSNINVSETKSSNSRKTQPQAPTKSTTTYKDLRTSACEITKIPLIEKLNENETLMIKSVFPDQQKIISSVKHDDDHHKKYDPTVEIKELKSFIFDDGGESDSSSDLFELTNCDLGYYSSGLPVFETTRMDTINRGAPISS